MTRSGLVLAALVLAWGCGSLSVEVAVLDPAYVEEKTQSITPGGPLSHVLGQTESTFQSGLDEIRDDHQRLGEGLVHSFGIPPTVPKGGEKRLEDEHDEARQNLWRLANRVQELHHELNQASGERRTHIRAQRDAALNRYMQAARKLTSYIEDDIASRVSGSGGWKVLGADPGLGGSVKGHKKKRVRLVEKVRSHLLGDLETLHASPYAYAIASAPEDRWAKRFNYACGGGAFGNVDVAIKLESESGDYTVKGLTFDPGDVALVASKVVTQSLVIAAQVYGVPVPKPTDTTKPGSALATSSSGVSEFRSAVEEKRLAHLRLQSALDGIAWAILRNEQHIKGTDPTMNQIARDSIKAAYDSRKANLVIGSR